VRKLVLHSPHAARRELQRIGVDPDACRLFVDKGVAVVLKCDGLSCAQANILKQTALLCGGDVAVARDVYHTATRKKTSALVFVNRRELGRMLERLAEQPWMATVRQELSTALTPGKAPVLCFDDTTITFSRTYIMGVINITADSFYRGSRYTEQNEIVRVACDMERSGADFIDIGTESSRPGARSTTVKADLKKLKSVLPRIARSVTIPISVDTYKSEIASFAIDHGAAIINDISGLRFDRKMVKLLARTNTALVIMHMKGTPRTMQRRPSYRDLMGEVHDFFRHAIEVACGNGISRDRIVLDPGLGFGKRLEDNYEIINRLEEFTTLDRPLLVGHSRKSFIGLPFGLTPEHRLEGTLGVEALLIKNGASIIRVHDVGEAKKVAMLIDRITR
jgi:dihydropteroate synthase